MRTTTTTKKKIKRIGRAVWLLLRVFAALALMLAAFFVMWYVAVILLGMR